MTKLAEVCSAFNDVMNDPEAKKDGRFAEAKVNFINEIKDYIDKQVAFHLGNAIEQLEKLK